MNGPVSTDANFHLYSVIMLLCVHKAMLTTPNVDTVRNKTRIHGTGGRIMMLHINTVFVEVTSRLRRACFTLVRVI